MKIKISKDFLKIMKHKNTFLWVGFLITLMGGVILAPFHLEHFLDLRYHIGDSVMILGVALMGSWVGLKIIFEEVKEEITYDVINVYED